MKFLKISGFSFLLFVSFATVSPVHSKSKIPLEKAGNPTFSADKLNYHSVSLSDKSDVIKTPTDGGIKEQIAKKYADRYQKWKAEFLSTETGRTQWKNYSENKNFILTITIGDEENQGAGTGEYKWDENGVLVAATIHLGSKINKGFPDPIYFPVMNSLSLIDFPRELNSDALAATKIAHEFGHVNLTARTKSEMFRLQNNLIPDYNKILLSNGYNTQDARLIDLVNRMGGTPVEIWENREYWSETNAMNFLIEKINQQNFYCRILSKIETNVKIYAMNYENRFQQIAQLNKPESCYW